MGLKGGRDGFGMSHDCETEFWLIDQWVPEGVNKHSQSVIDLFDFIRGSAKVILHDLPLGEYKRAVYLIDLSKVSHHATIADTLLTMRLSRSQLANTRLPYLPFSPLIWRRKYRLRPQISRIRSNLASVAKQEIGSRRDNKLSRVYKLPKWTPL